MLKDLRYACRTLIKAPGLTAVAILSLALGIGANSAIFSLINGVLLRPLPKVGNSQELVRIYTTESGSEVPLFLSHLDYQDYVEQSEIFSGISVFFPAALRLGVVGQPEMIWGYLVSGNYFEVLEVEGILGRGFLPAEDETPGTHPVAVLSHAFWQRRWGADPELIGKTIQLNNQQFTVVGIAPEDFVGSEVFFAPDVWLPMMTYETTLPALREVVESRDGRFLRAFARPRPGVSLAQAEAWMETISGNLADEYPNTNKGVTAHVVSEREGRFEPGIAVVVTLATTMLMALVGLILLIACANVANLLLSRSRARAREIGIRLSLGASRVRLIRQLLTESTVLSLLAGVLGLAIGAMTAKLLSTLRLPISIPVVFDFGLDVRVLVFTFVVAVVAGVVFGLVPALQASRQELVPALKMEAGDPGPGKWILRKIFVVLQVAVALLVLNMAGLFIRSLGNARDVELGMNPRNVLVLSLDLGIHGYAEERGRRLFDDLLTRIRTLPGVSSASLASPVPMDFLGLVMNVKVEGYQPVGEEDDVQVFYSIVGTDYFEAMQTSILQGRALGEADRADSRPVVVVNQTVAQNFWPDQDPLGKRIQIERDGAQVDCEVVGVAQDGKYRFVGERPVPFLFLPFEQSYTGAVSLLVRTAGAPRSVLDSVLNETRGLDPGLVFSDVRVLEEMVNGLGLLPILLAAALVGIFGVLALVLASVGLYGVMSYNVAQRTWEIGLRQALGARPWDLLTLVLRQGMALTLIGLAIGLALSLVLTRSVAALLLNLSPTDPPTLIGVGLMLTAVALLACLVPARRAMRLQPTEALRQE